jgi:hypothetical protein
VWRKNYLFIGFDDVFFRRPEPAADTKKIQPQKRSKILEIDAGSFPMMVLIPKQQPPDGISAKNQAAGR